MLAAFLECATSGARDERLDANTAAEECAFVDRTLLAYFVQLSDWLAKRLGAPLDDGIRYALAEILAVDGQRTQMTDEEIAGAWERMSRLGEDAVAAAVADPRERGERLIQRLQNIG
jgi:hypothetical protein